MPWTFDRYPASMRRLPPWVRHKAIEIANALLDEGMDEGGDPYRDREGEGMGDAPHRRDVAGTAIARMREARMIHEEVLVGPSALMGELMVPDRARGLVVFAHGSGSNRRSTRK